MEGIIGTAVVLVLGVAVAALYQWLLNSPLFEPRATPRLPSDGARQRLEQDEFERYIRLFSQLEIEFERGTSEGRSRRYGTPTPPAVRDCFFVIH